MPINKYTKCINMLNFLRPKILCQVSFFGYYFDVKVLFSQMHNFFIVHFLFVTAKIRRLYDIANILATLNLIRKIRITDIRDRKPTYQYIGPDLEQVHELNGWYNVKRKINCKYWLFCSLFDCCCTFIRISCLLIFLIIQLNFGYQTPIPPLLLVCWSV